ncbi:ABC transporter ATP-binding protein [Micromonospora zingiberis]|uniref:ABC transporter ATP-binding protein n=1 Tax=Micromonospora zingiberis TaxID=2053011 RepID=A0A4R0GQ16_9ACTN|nr:ABC transporter ATP-binding protein [Micromonospora zingiberis]TCB99660.1 ABC transporter ATP-binding protein [Micromonospora zingiberis]
MPDRLSGPTELRAWLVARAARSWPVLVGSLLGGLAAAGFAVLAPVVTGFAVDGVLAGGATGRLLALGAAVLLASQLLRAAVLQLRQRAAIAFAARTERDLRTVLVRQTLHHGDPAHRLSLANGLVGDLRVVRAAIYPGLDITVSSLAFLVVAIAVAPLYHPSLLLAPALFTVGYLVVGARHLRSLTTAAERVRQDGTSLVAVVAEALGNVEAIRDADLPDAVWDRLRTAAVAHHDTVVRRAGTERRAPMFLLLGVAQGVGFGHALLLANRGTLSLGDLAGYTGVLMLLGAPAFSAVIAFSLVADGRGALRRLAATFALAAPPSSLRATPSVDVPVITARGLVLDVAPGASSVGTNLTIAPRSLVVITGEVGAGKSVLARTLAGLRAPRAGGVWIDGDPTDAWDPVVLSNVVAHVDEEDALFSTSLADNVRVGRLDAGQREQTSAADRAGVDEFARSLPDGYDTLLGEGGGHLSGGQRQRVRLARALLSPARVLVLDDPFSGLDAETARRLAAELVEEARNRTVVVVTERQDVADAAAVNLCVSNGVLTVQEAAAQETA